MTESPSPASRDKRLRRILAMTDPALASLAPEALFDELLERIRTQLSVDAAAILLLDQDGQHLVTVAGKGLEDDRFAGNGLAHDGLGHDGLKNDGLADDAHAGLRVAIGEGFAGRVAASRAPVIVDNVDARTLLGIPMLAHGNLVGVLHVARSDARPFDERDVALLQVAADRAASASQASDSQADRLATLALQRGLLPTKLPTVDGIELAARYLPGHRLGVGGDWYDVFTLPTGRLGVVVGDVSGHGLRAAVVMGRLRSALRAYTLIEDDPAAVLTYLDRKITHFEAGNLATVLYATVSADRQEMTVSSAGHLPPILACPDESAELLPVPADLPVGVGDSTPRRSTTIPLDPGATVAFFTDGLVERRHEHIDQGLGRLTALLRAETPEAACAALVAGMDVGRADDDVALLALQTRG